MVMHMFPVIDPIATGENILRLRKACGFSVGDLQQYFGFEQPQAIYKWQKGRSLPTVDHLYALCVLFSMPMEEILILQTPKQQLPADGQQTEVCCPSAFCLIGQTWAILIWFDNTVVGQGLCSCRRISEYV